MCGRDEGGWSPRAARAPGGGARLSPACDPQAGRPGRRRYSSIQARISTGSKHSRWPHLIPARTWEVRSCPAVLALERVLVRPNLVEFVVVGLSAWAIASLVWTAVDGRERGERPVRVAISAFSRGKAGFASALGSALAGLAGLAALSFLAFPIVPFIVFALAVGPSLLYLSSRLARRARREFENRRPSPAAVDGSSRVAVAAGTIGLLGLYSVVVLGRPAWVDTYGCGDQAGPAQQSHSPFAPVELPSGTSGELAVALGVPDLAFPGGHPRSIEVVPTTDGGAALLRRGGTWLTLGELDERTNSLLRRGGFRKLGNSSAVNFGVIQNFGARVEGSGWTGSIFAQVCSGFRSPSSVEVRFTVGPERLGDCAPKERWATCEEVYSAAEQMVGSLGRESAPRARVTVTGTAFELRQDVPVLDDWNASAINAAEDAVAALQRMGWSAGVESSDADHAIVQATRRGSAQRLRFEYSEVPDHGSGVEATGLIQSSSIG